jgi:hypothetical protein
MTAKLPFPENLIDMQRMFPDEKNCTDYLEDVRWSDGFKCPHCGSKAEPYRFENRPEVLRCRGCERDISLTAGTVMHRSHTPICVWFWAAYLVSSQIHGISAVQFQRQLGLTRYETAFQILHKLRSGMVRPDRDRIGGEWPVEIDEVLIGGRTRGEGKGVHHKTTVVGAVEIRHGKKATGHDLSYSIPKRGKTYAGRLRLRIVESRAGKELEQFVTENVERHTLVTTDGWEGYKNLGKLSYDHEYLSMGGDPENVQAALPMIHIVFSNLKAWLQGTFHGRVEPKHLQAYLNEYVFRFNRRFWPFNAFNSLLGIGVDVESPTYEQLYSGEWVHPNP